MKTALRVLLGLCLVTVCAARPEAKEWRGIVPLRSNREDVTRVLGASPDANNIRARYSLKDEDVYIVFATRESYVDECVKRLPLGTVMQIQVTPKAEVRLADLGLDEGRLKKFDPSDPPGLGYAAYFDEQEGLIVRTYKGKVEEVVYIAAAADRHLCPAYYKDQTSFVGLIVDPPALSLDCPKGSPRAGERVTFTANLAGAPADATPTFKWDVSAGAIVEGRGTSSITVDTRGLAGRRIRATVEVGGVGEGFSNKESCEVQVAPGRRTSRRPRRRS